VFYYRSATKTFGAVIPILGITWVFGVMAFNESSLVFQYIFAITNSLQVYVHVFCSYFCGDISIFTELSMSSFAGSYILILAYPT
jgi:hypothetical protein